MKAIKMKAEVNYSGFDEMLDKDFIKLLEKYGYKFVASGHNVESNIRNLSFEQAQENGKPNHAA